MLPAMPDLGGFDPDMWISRNAAAEIMGVFPNTVPLHSMNHRISHMMVAARRYYYKPDAERAAGVIAAQRRARDPVAQVQAVMAEHGLTPKDLE